MGHNIRGLIIAIRIVAFAATVVIVSLLWQVMTRLSWQVDCVIAAASALAFSYKFERDGDENNR
ncbi:MAG: hypothetical protein ACRD1Q_02260 [Vicinamibacterales bacterium]